MDELITLNINGKQHMFGFKPLNQELYEAIEPCMGHDFARYVQNKIEELQEKTEQEYWQNHSDEQVYEEELNKMRSMLNEVWDYLHEIKLIAQERKNMPKWGKLAIDAMKLMEEYM